MHPLVSVVMPAYNVPISWLEKSVESILDQTFKDFELIIVDDGSTNGLYDICQTYARRDTRIRLFRLEENRGALAASNYALQHARADLIARHDADDISLPDRLGRQFQYMREHPEVVLSGLQMTLMFEPDVPDEMRRHALQYLSWYNSCVGDNIERFFVKNVCLASGTFMFYKDRFVEAGMYREESRYVEEEVVLRMKRFGRVAKLDVPLYIYRIHNRSTYSLHAAAVDQRMSEIRSRVLKELLPHRVKTAVWGTGKGGREFLSAYLSDPYPSYMVIAIIDGSGAMVGQQLLGFEIQSKRDFPPVDKILIAVSQKSVLHEIRKDLLLLGYSEDQWVELYPEMD